MNHTVLSHTEIAVPLSSSARWSDVVLYNVIVNDLYIIVCIFITTDPKQDVFNIFVRVDDISTAPLGNKADTFDKYAAEDDMHSDARPPSFQQRKCKEQRKHSLQM